MSRYSKEMKNTLATFLIACFWSTAMFAQNADAVLATGTWYQFSIDTTGVFKIDKNLLESIGINLNGTDPRTLKIYGNGGQLLPESNVGFRYSDLQENAIYVSGEEDGTFDGSDYLLFYGKGPHSWSVNPIAGTATHQQNIYSEKAYYFITVGGANGKRIETAPPITSTATTQITTFNEALFYEKEQRNLLAVGRKWFGEDFSIVNTQSFSFPFQNAVPGAPITVKVAAVAQSPLASSMTVHVNGQAVSTGSFTAVSNGSHTLAHSSFQTSTLANNSNEITVQLTYNNNGVPSAKSYLDFIEVTGTKQLIAGDRQFSFRSYTAATSTGTVAYEIQNAANISQLWNVTDAVNPTRVTNQDTGNNFVFNANGGSLEAYIVVHPTHFLTPETVANNRVPNQNLHALQDVNYLIITTEALRNQATRIADHHIANSGITVQVVLLDEIYNEFSSGSPDITGVRDFIKHLYETNTAPDKKLKYVCFFGDSSYDYKDRLPGNNNIMPTYQSVESFSLVSSYVTDDYFVMMDPNEGNMLASHTLDIASGRIPVTSVQQATDVVDKILSYYATAAMGDWRNNITLVADDIDAAGEQVLQEAIERVADSIKAHQPIFNVSKIYADAYTQQTSSGGERYPEVNTAISNILEKGTLVFDYFGHGGEDGFAAERFLENPQIEALNNGNTLPLFVTVTCEFARFDNPERTTAGEKMFWNSHGGAASLITTTREVYISVGSTFNEKLIREILSFEGEDHSIAEALLATKNTTTSSQKFFIYYFGDPAMKLAIPKPNVRLTKMNGIPITQALDTLKALSRVSFEGVVADASNAVLTDFNGTVATTIFDKPIDKTTLDNDGFGITMTFDSQESKLFKGQATVTNGLFSFEFIVPRDVRIAYGKSKLSFYATNQEIDKSGANFDVVAGGINPDAPVDNTGPEIQLFMNDESFIDGGTTNMSPNLLVQLSDVSGINTSLTAVDHDIVAILDGNAANPILLNDYYETALDDFTNGTATYPFRNLSVGLHTVTVKAWDTYNNSSEATLTFRVVSDAGLTLAHVLNYPNPFVNYTEFWFTHNKPNEPLEVQVQVFTVAGKLIKTMRQMVQNTGTLSREITWNGLDDFGNKIGKGVYVYKLKVTAVNSQLTTEKYEKLVLLQ